jgi:hypothetical protein
MGGPRETRTSGEAATGAAAYALALALLAATAGCTHNGGAPAGQSSPLLSPLDSVLPSPTATRRPDVGTATPGSTSTPTRFVPPTWPPAATYGPLPEVTASAPGLEVWIVRFFGNAEPPCAILEYDPLLWQLDTENPPYPVLAHRYYSYCWIRPDVGHGLGGEGEGWLRASYRWVGGVYYYVKEAGQDDRMTAQYYNPLDGFGFDDYLHIFRVTLGEEWLACLEDVEVVMATLGVTDG